MNRGTHVRITSGKHKGQTGEYLDDFTMGRVIPGMAFEDESQVRLDSGGTVTVPTAALQPITAPKKKRR